MQIIDFHGDALFMIWRAKGKLAYSDAKELETSKERLLEGGVKAQCFAIFVPPEVKTEQKFEVALEQIHYFYHEVLGKNPEMKHIKEWGDFDSLRDGEIGAMLTLEGVDLIGNDLHKLHLLYQLGVRSIGLTWNNANLACDGAGEPRNAGLTKFGKEIVSLNNQYKVLTDVSHLSERGFWDVLEIADYLTASHSNSKACCNHPRNLSDEQAKAMFDKGGMIHVFYGGVFIKNDKNVKIADLIKHIDHFCALGGARHIGLGSDFDGIDSYTEHLENAAMSQNLINELLKHYSEDEVRGFASENFLRHRPTLSDHPTYF